MLGMGGAREFIGGLTFISHIAPAAATLVAFAFLPVPAMAGLMLAASVGVGFYPAFMVPEWAGYYWRNQGQCVRFLARRAAVGLATRASTHRVV